MKKRLKKLETGSEGSLGHGGFSSASQPMPRGQWERRLQTDIHMAKRALSEALSLDKAPSLTEPNISDVNSFCSSTKPTQSLSYVSSADNIAHLLKVWMKNPPKASRGNSSVTQNSFNSLVIAGADTASSKGINPIGTKGNSSSVELSETSESLLGYESLDSSNSEFSQPLSLEVTLFQEESKPDCSEVMSFYLLEKWLLDDTDCLEKVSCSGITSSVDATVF